MKNKHTLGVGEENDPVVSNKLVELDGPLLQISQISHNSLCSGERRQTLVVLASKSGAILPRRRLGKVSVFYNTYRSQNVVLTEGHVLQSLWLGFVKM